MIFNRLENLMKNASLMIAAVTLTSFAAVVVYSDDKPRGKADKKVPPVLNFKMKRLDGKEGNLADYQGKVVMMVNVASQCGLTPQYEQLEALHEKYAEKGLAV